MKPHILDSHKFLTKLRIYRALFAATGGCPITSDEDSCETGSHQAMEKDKMHCVMMETLTEQACVLLVIEREKAEKLLGRNFVILLLWHWLKKNTKTKAWKIEKWEELKYKKPQFLAPLTAEDEQK